MRNLKPLYLMHDEDVTKAEVEAVLSGIIKMIQFTRTENGIEVINFGAWNQFPGRAYGSVNWYLKRGLESSSRRTQLNAATMLLDMSEDPWRRSTPHYDVLVTSIDLYAGTRNNAYVLGYANKFLGTVVSTCRYKELAPKDRYELLETDVMHEVGHVFGLIHDDRINANRRYGGAHCANSCIMRQGMNVDEWQRITEDRVKRGLVLCGQCQQELWKNFH